MAAARQVSEWNGAKLLVKALEEEGVTIVFGLPGEENADFAMALSESTKIRMILVRHEQGAAFMADVYGRLTGEPGVCFGTLGPGATNLVTGVADGNMDRAPMIVITGQADTYRMHKESHQMMDVVGMFKPITKWGYSCLRPEAIAEVTHKAFKIALTEKPGACHIELPEDVAAAELDKAVQPLARQALRRAVCDDKVADQAFALIAAAKKPVILAGNGCVRKRAATQLLRLVEATGMSVISTFMAKGCVPRTHASFLGTVGLQSHDYTNVALDGADLVIAVGYDLVEYHPRLWNPKSSHTILHIDFLPAEADAMYSPKLEVVSDLGHALWALNERIDAASYKVDADWSARLTEQVRDKVFGDIAEFKDDDQKGAVRPQKALWDIRQVLGPDDIIISDVGAHKMWVARYYQCDKPNTCLISNGFCSMGVWVGCIGAKLAFPDRRVLAVCGDGGFLMNVQEMETAVRVGANVVVCVWVDNAYGLIEWKQQGAFGKHTDLSFANPDFMALSAAFGWAGFEVNDSADLAPTLEKAFDAGKPALVAMKVDYRENQLLSKRLGEIRGEL